MNYTLHQLSIFLKIAQTQSITKAAEELHLTQPAVSIQLKNFQQQFDIPLTEVINKRLYITDFGREIALAAARILDEVSTIDHKTMAYRGKLTGKLKISVVSTGKYVIPYFLSAFLRQHEGIELQLDVSNKSRVVESLQHNEVDFSLVSVMPDQLRLSKIELMPNKLFLVGNADSLDNRQVYEIKLLESIPLIYREQGSATRRAMEQVVESNGLRARMKMELTSNEAVKQAVIAGLGYSIMPLIGIKNELRTGQLRIIPVEGLPMITDWNLVWLEDKKLSPAAGAFVEHLRLEKDRIISREFGQLFEWG
jgi:DNA-binding transcriptional LysR family regulator